MNKNQINLAGDVVHTCNISTLGSQGGQITRGQEFQACLANVAKPLSTKGAKISWVWGVHACGPSYSGD